MRFLFVLLALLALVAFPSAGQAGKAKAPAIPTIPLSLAVSQLDGQASVSAAWVKQQVDEANRLFGPHGLSFAVAGSRDVAESYARLETRDDRDALGKLVEPKVVNAFFVTSLRDVDRPERYIQGVRWRHRRQPRLDYVVIASNATPTTLAHELGHFFGNGHSQVDNNLMSYKRSDPSKVALDKVQGAKIRAAARRLLAGRALLPFTKATTKP